MPSLAVLLPWVAALALLCGSGCCTAIGQAAFQPSCKVYGPAQQAWVVPDGAGGERLLVRVAAGPHTMQCLPAAAPFATFPAGQRPSILYYRLPAEPGGGPLPVVGVEPADGFEPLPGARELPLVTRAEDGSPLNAIVGGNAIVRHGIEHRIALDDGEWHLAGHLGQAAILPVTLALDAPLLPIYIPCLAIGLVKELAR